MRKSGREARIRLFERGNDRCPICLSPFTKEAVELGESVTLEHVPPRSLNPAISRQICLTCADCNQEAGQGIDQAAYKLLHPPKATVELKGVPHTGEITVEGKKSFKITMGPARIPMKDMRDLTKDEFKVRLTIPDLHYGSVSWLKSAYLALFSLLGVHGYRYAKSSVGCLIREQIMHPERKLIKHCMVETEEWGNGSGIYMQTKRPSVWCVQMGKWGVLLPRTGDVSLYEKFDKPQNEIDNVPVTQFTANHAWKLTKLWRNEVGMIRIDDIREVDKKIGRDLFGLPVMRRNSEGEWHGVIADYGNDYLTLLPIRWEESDHT